MRRVRRDRRGTFTPYRLLAGGEGGVRDADRDGLRDVTGQVAATHVADLVLGVAVTAARGDRADAGVRAVGVDRQHQPLSKHLDREAAATGGRADLAQTSGAQDGLFEDVDQSHGSPAALHLGLDPPQVARFRSGLVLRQRDRTGRPVRDLKPVQRRDCGVQILQCGGHLTAQIADEHSRIQRFAQFAIAFAPPLLEVRR